MLLSSTTVRSKSPLKRSQHGTEHHSTFAERCLVMLSGVEWGCLDLFKSHFLLYQSIEIKCAAGEINVLLLYSPAQPFTFRVFVSVD